MRISKKWLAHRVLQLNESLGLPTDALISTAKGIEWNIGCIVLDKDSTGYQLEQVSGAKGGTTHITGRMNGTDMALYISGLFTGIQLTRGNEVV